MTRGLTPRQQEVAALVAAGLTDAQIAEQLGISQSTVNYHLGDIRLRLGLRNRVQIAVWAAQRGLSPPPR